MKKSLIFLASLSLLIMGCNNASTPVNNVNDNEPVEPVNPIIHVESISLNETLLNLKKGDTYTLKATILPENATNKNISWSSSNSDVVSVIDGIITALKEGEVDIAVKTQDSGKTAKTHVVVEEENPVTPAEPETPEEPDTPENPEEPEEPENPEEPEQPDIPDNPDIPTTPEEPEEPEINYVSYTIDFENCGITTDSTASNYEDKMKSIFNEKDTILSSVAATGFCQINTQVDITSFTPCSASSDGETIFTFSKELNSVTIVASPYKKYISYNDTYSIDEEPLLIVNEEEWELEKASETSEHEKYEKTFYIEGNTLSLAGLAGKQEYGHRVFVCSLELEFINE